MARAREYIDSLTADGRISFTIKEFCDATKFTYESAKQALKHLQTKKDIASPYRGYYLILTPEFRQQGCLPAEYFIDDLMPRLKQNYYVCLLSAAAYQGAGHHQPQVLHVMSDEKIENIKCANTHIKFIKNNNCSKTPTLLRNTKTGRFKISTPEATAMDMMKYMKQSGGAGRIATVLDELAEFLDTEKLNELIFSSKEHVWIHRLGYLLDKLGHHEKTEKIYEAIKGKSVPVIPLVPYNPITGVPRDKKWNIAINADARSDLDDTD